MIVKTGRILRETGAIRPRLRLFSRTAPIRFAPSSWRASLEPGEDPAEMALIDKAAHDGDFRQIRVSVQQQLARSFNPFSNEPLMRRGAHRPPERTGEISGRQATLLSKFGDGRIAVEMRTHEIERAT